MPLWFWLLIGGYVLAALCCWRMFAGHLAWRGETMCSSPAPAWGFGILVGFFFALAWPLVMLVEFWLKNARWPLVIGAERDRRGFEHEQAARKREEAIHRAEREVGIDA